MSSWYVSFEVWENGRLAAIRFKELVSRANTLCAELSEVAELWQEARAQYGEEFPAWSYGDTEWQAFFVRDLAKRVGKVQRTKYTGGNKSGSTLGATRDDLKSVARDVSELESVFPDLVERVGKAKREYAQHVAKAKRNRVLTSLQAASQLQATDTQAAVSSAKEEEAQREERERHRYAEEVSRTLETLAAEVSPQDHTAIEQQAQEAVESPASRRQALLMQLRFDIQRANKAGQARQRMVAQAEQWRERLLGLEGTEVEQLDVALRRIADGDEPLPPDMAQRVEDVVARATEASNRAYALGVITEELESLGYVVEVGFETASAQAPEMLLHKPDMEDDYHVSLRVETGALHNQVVREASDPATEARSASGQMSRWSALGAKTSPRP